MNEILDLPARELRPHDMTSEGEIIISVSYRLGEGVSYSTVPAREWEMSCRVDPHTGDLLHPDVRYEITPHQIASWKTVRVARQTRT